MTQPLGTPLTHLVAQYLSLEELIVTEELLDLCGATIDWRALPVLKRRLHEEKVQSMQFEARGYIRRWEKCEQLIVSLTDLITTLEGASHDEPHQTQH
jgi:hypothetical protein